MTTILIYKLRSDKKMSAKGIWKDGTWKLDKENFSEIPNIDQYDAQMILDRFDGPLYFAVDEMNAGKTTSTISGSHNRSAVAEDDAQSDFIEAKKDLANKLEDGDLDKSLYTDEKIEEIKTWPWYDG